MLFPLSLPHHGTIPLSRAGEGLYARYTVVGGVRHPSWPPGMTTPNLNLNEEAAQPAGCHRGTSISSVPSALGRRERFQERNISLSSPFRMEATPSSMLPCVTDSSPTRYPPCRCLPIIALHGERSSSACPALLFSPATAIQSQKQDKRRRRLILPSRLPACGLGSSITEHRVPWQAMETAEGNDHDRLG